MRLLLWSGRAPESSARGVAQAKALAVNESNLQGELDGAVLALQERAALLDALNAKLTSVAETLDAFEHELQARRCGAPRGRTSRKAVVCLSKLPQLHSMGVESH